MADTENQARLTSGELKEQEILAQDKSHSAAAALHHAIAAAELYMSALREGGPRQAAHGARLKQKFNEMVALGQKLKYQNPKTEPQKVDVRQPSAQEQIVLERSSRVHGNHFPPWQSDPTEDVFCLPRDGTRYIDPTEYAMSQLQDSILHEWRRPAALMNQARTEESCDMLMMLDGTCDLVQDITTDCSVVASLCAAMKILVPNNGNESLLSSLMFPFDHEKGRPLVSDNGKYIFRMHFNGCFREVVVDDRLPISRPNVGRNLFVIDRRNPDLLWPALMEKAYLKVRGGYDFPGSNSGTDLWVLTGWIPEQLFLQNEDVDLVQAWDRISEGYRLDGVIITLGTGRLTPTEEEALGLAGEHDYAVLGLDSTEGSRRLLVKNPWCDGVVWKGRGSPDVASSIANLSLGLRRPGPSPNVAPAMSAQGTFWITLEEVAQNFESMYLNWKPSYFKHRQDHHFTWGVPDKNMADILAYNPQYSIRSSSGTEVWILLSRHFADEELEIARNERPGSLHVVARRLGFTSISVFENQGKRVQTPEGSTYRGPFVDSPQTLAKLTLDANKSYTVVMAHEDLPLSKYTCTFSFFSDYPLEVQQAQDEMDYHREISSSWTRRTAGGNASSALYSQNPQFSMKISRATPLSILLSTASRDIAIHADVVWSPGKRVTAIGRKDVVASSGDYRCGTTSVRVPQIEAGTYVVVCSTFEPGQLADFKMCIGTMAECDVQPVPGEAAGLLRSRLPDLAFGVGEEVKRAKITAPRLTRAYAVARCPTYSYQNGHHIPRAALRVSVVNGRGPHAKVLAISGDGGFREPATALRTLEFDIEPDRLWHEELWLVVELLGSHGAWNGIEVEILGDNLVRSSPWEVMDP